LLIILFAIEIAAIIIILLLITIGLFDRPIFIQFNCFFSVIVDHSPIFIYLFGLFFKYFIFFIQIIIEF